MNVLAIDYGERWLGLALGNTEEKFVVPLETLDREVTPDVFASVQRICEERDIGRIVVGLPLTLGGVEGERVEAVHVFVSKLKEKLNLSVDLIDERLTSHQARHEEGAGGGDEHSRAAALILESIL
ncbi:MAG: Holliday junction resolvase RuvX [bacterium]|nr:Holliday junction resolvase RuvX [bacterium]